jgi:hypothetical protein
MIAGPHSPKQLAISADSVKHSHSGLPAWRHAITFDSFNVHAFRVSLADCALHPKVGAGEAVAVAATSLELSFCPDDADVAASLTCPDVAAAVR